MSEAYKAKRRPVAAPAAAPGRNITIKHLAAELGLSITTISRALNGYPDVGESTRERVAEAARQMGYRPNRNAQRLVRGRTHNFAWVQADNERKFVDPHFVEVMAGVLRAARASEYDIVLSSDTPEHELASYDRYVNDNSVDGFIVDLPRENDPRIDYLQRVGRPFVVHGRTAEDASYGWVDIDNYETFYRLTRLLLDNGHRQIAFINGDETYTYALFRRRGAVAAVADAGLPPERLAIYNSLHPMGDAGFALTSRALEDGAVTALLYSSTLMAMEGHAVVAGSGRQLALATMDDELHYLDMSRFAGSISFARSSLRDAGAALVAELMRQCDGSSRPSGTLMPTRYQVADDLDASGLDAPVRDRR